MPTMDARLDGIAARAERERPQALQELAAGRKRGHWVWWIFPTLAVRGGDINSLRQIEGGADLQSVAEAAAYIAHPGLRPGLLSAMRAADAAFSVAELPGPWTVLDKGFGRKVDGVWVGGPVDAYKCWCSATLFAAVAHKQNDAEVRNIAVKVLRHFDGDIKYRSAGPGTAGFVDGEFEQPTYVLKGADEETLRLVGGATWEEIFAAAKTTDEA